MSAWTRRVLLVEDDTLLASLMGQVLTDQGFVVETCSTEAEARRAVRTLDPDVALIDVHLGTGPFGLTLAHVLSRTHPHIGILLLSRFEDLTAAGLDAGGIPDGSVFLPKSRITDCHALVDAVESVLRGHPAPPGAADGTGTLSRLTRTQLAVLRLAALGLTNAVIAERHGTTPNNIEKRLRGVYATLGIATDGPLNPRVEAVRRYIAAAGMPLETTAVDGA